MPPRKSNVSAVSANGDLPAAAAGTPAGKEKEKKDKDKDEIAIEDLTMPRTMIQRLAKGVLPEGTPLQRDAVTALCKAATVFVSHVAGAAADECALANRRTVNPQDVFAALRETEHAAMIPRLEQELARYIDVGTSKRNEYRRKMKEKEDGGVEGGADGAADGEGTDKAVSEADAAKPSGELTHGHGGPRSAKRVKGADGAAAAPGEEGDGMDVDEEEEGEGQDEEEDEEEEEEDEGEGEEEDDEGDETEEADDDDDDNDDADIDPAAAQLARENRAVNEAQSDEESD